MTINNVTLTMCAWLPHGFTLSVIRATCMFQTLDVDIRLILMPEARRQPQHLAACACMCKKCLMLKHYQQLHKRCCSKTAEVLTALKTTKFFKNMHTDTEVVTSFG